LAMLNLLESPYMDTSSTDNWIVARSQLHCGILRTSLGALKAGLPDLAIALRKSLGGQGTLVDLYRQRQDELQILLYHAPFRDAGLYYGLRTSASREVPGDSLEWKNWRSQWSKFPKTGRDLRAYWSHFASSRFSISMVTTSTGPSEYARLSFHRAIWGSSFSPDFQLISNDAVKAFAASVGLESEQLESPSNTNFISVATPDLVGTIPKVSLSRLELERCFHFFESSLSAVSKVLGEAEKVGLCAMKLRQSG
jgi:hypothetical protein